jgi:Ca-activated chloride channel family protein
MKRLALLPVLCLANATTHAASWSDMWLTRDQQAQRLLDSSQPAAAAPLFTDARHQAYAQLQAGNFAKAADLLAPFNDADSLYNRGNALAHTGQLREALKAYDAALAASPGNQDVIHNRDLVKRALESHSSTAQQQKDGSQSGAGRGQKGSNGADSGSSSGQQGQSSADRSARNQDSGAATAQPGAAPHDNPQAHGESQSQANAPSQPGSRPGSQSQGGGAGHSDNQTQSGNQSQANAQSPQANQATNQSGGASTSQGGGQTATPSQQGTASSTAGNLAQKSAGQTTGNDARTQSPSSATLAENGSQSAGSQASGPEAQTAQQDAAAGVRYQQSQTSATGKTGATVADRPGAMDSHGSSRVDSNAPPPHPPSEQTLALDQWLRSIPEDSGELLRRKFLIEHRMRQQEDAQ